MAPGRILEPPGPYFPTFLKARALALSECSECSKTMILMGRNTLRKPRAQHKNREKSFQHPCVGGCLRRSWPTCVLELAELVFGRAWGPPRSVLGRSWAPLDHLWTTLWQLLDALRHLLVASCALLERSWSHLGSLGCLQPRFWRVFGASGLGVGDLWWQFL